MASTENPLDLEKEQREPGGPLSLEHGDQDRQATLPPITNPSGQNGFRKEPIGSPKPPFALSREIAFVALICCAQLLTQACLAQAVVPNHDIGASFANPNPGQLSWFSASYSLTIGTFILIAGRLGDMFGHKLMFILGFSWWALWSLIAGLTIYSQSQIFFDICRAFQGIGPAVLLPNSLAILGRTYPPGRRKEMVFAMFGATAPVGFVVGAVFSSIFAQLLWWPWALWCMAIACAFAAIGAVFVIPGSDDIASHGLQSFDFLGAVTGITGLVLFNVAWNQAPVVGWKSPLPIVLLILGALFLVLFFFAEKHVAQPLLPLDSLTKEVGFVLALIALGWSSFGIWIYYLAQFTEVIRQNSPLSYSAQISPAAISGLCAALTTGFLLSRVKTAYIMTAALLAFCIGNILAATMSADQSYWIQTFLAYIITPWGMDLSFPAASIILSDFVPKRHQGIAGSLVTTVVNYSISIGLGIAGTVEVYVNKSGDDLLRGYRGAWYSGIGLSGAGVLLSLYFILDGHREAIYRQR